MIIQHNLPAMNSQRQLEINNGASARNLERLSTGYRIAKAADDPAGLAISEFMRGQIRGLTKASQNAQNGISLIQTAEGGLNEAHSVLNRMRELAVSSSNGTYNDGIDRVNLEQEFASLKDEIERISTATNYNSQRLLDGSMAARGKGGNLRHDDTGDYEGGMAKEQGSMKFHIGADSQRGNTVSLDVRNMGRFGLELTDSVSVSTAASARSAITVIDKAIGIVSETRADLGALQNRLEHTVRNLGTTGVNLQAAESRIRDVDMAKEMMSYAKNIILAQSSQAMLAQSSAMPQGVLQLLGAGAGSGGFSGTEASAAPGVSADTAAPAAVSAAAAPAGE